MGLGVTAVGLSLPARLALRLYFSADAGSNLSATLLARAGQRPNLDFGFPFGPVTLALQEAALALMPRGPYAMAALTMVGTLAFAAGASWAIRRQRLSWAPALLLWTATATVGVSGLWEPVYALESAALLWAIVLFAAGSTGVALAACVLAALLKPSMGVVLGALLLAAVAGRRAWHELVAPLLTAVALTGTLLAVYGVRGFGRLALPLAGARDYSRSHYAFFSRHGNPFLVPGAHAGLYLGTPLGAWGIATLALLAALVLLRPRPFKTESRWWAAAACALGTLAFIAAFYSWQGSYWYYCTLPLAGLAVLPWPARRWLHAALATLAALALLGTLTAVRADLHLWRTARPSVLTAGLWAEPAEAAQWRAFTQAHPPGARPLFLTGSGAPEALFPAYGPAWHGFLYPGEATAAELQSLAARAAAAHCIAYAPGMVLPEAAQAALRRLRPVRQGTLFDTYGCR